MRGSTEGPAIPISMPQGTWLKGRLDDFNPQGLLYQKHHLSHSGFRGVSWGHCFFVNGLEFPRLGPAGAGLQGTAPEHLHQLRRQKGNRAVAELAGVCAEGQESANEVSAAPSPGRPAGMPSPPGPALTRSHFGKSRSRALL